MVDPPFNGQKRKLANKVLRVRGRSRVKVGCVIPAYNTPFTEISEIANCCEKFGFDSVWTYDHFFLDRKPILECFTVLAAISEKTKKVEVGSLVASNLKRHPSILAKMLTSLNMISNGRLVFGIGSGGRPEELEACGIRFPKIEERFRRLAETVKLLRHLFHDGKGSFDGEFYHLSKFAVEGSEFRNCSTPIIVGGGGHRNISIAALWGDGWNVFNPTVEDFLEQYHEFRNYCANHHRNWRTKRVSVAVTCVVENDSKTAMTKFRRMYPRNKPYENYQIPRYVGSINDLPGFLLSYVATGADELIIDLPDAARLDLIEVLGEYVLPVIWQERNNE